MKRTTAWRFAAISALLLAAAGLFFLHHELFRSSDYVTSDACAGCHAAKHLAWKETLHPKMFRPVKGPEDLLGDFAANDPAVTFKPDEVEFVLGNKWEQVYVRRIDGEYYPFTAKWLVMEKRWVPFHVEDWQKVTMSTQCNGCHVTGFDPVSYEFSEFGIGCEACHGAGRDHAMNRKIEAEPFWCGSCHDAKERRGRDIISSVAPSVCAQCHDRGASKGGDQAGAFNFPVNFTPGGDIAQSFEPLGPAQDNKGKFWWGLGISRNRHQEYADWNLSGHAKSLERLVEGKGEVCPNSGAKTACLHCHSTDYRHAPEGQKPTLDEARYGVTCVACHDPHGTDRQSTRPLRGNAVCGDCHMANLAAEMAAKRRAHTPCPPGAVHCEDCHMPRVVETGGFFSLRSHAFRIVRPEETRGTKMPNSCRNGGCHADRDIEWAIEAYRKHYPEHAEAASTP